MDIAAHMFNRFTDVFAAMPPLQLGLFISLFVFAIVAGNAVFALHYRRVGKPILTSMLDLTSFPILDFNTKEWLLLAGVFSISMLLIFLAAHSG